MGESPVIFPCPLQSSETVNHALVGGNEGFVDRLPVSLAVGLPFRLRQSFQSLQALVEGFSHEAVLCVQKIGAAGRNNPVNGPIAHSQACLGFLTFKGENTVIVCADGGEEGEVVLHILGSIEGIFRQEKGKLGLDSQRGGERLVIKLQAISCQKVVKIGGENGIGQALILPENTAVHALQLVKQLLGLRQRLLAVLKGYGAQRPIIVCDSIGGRICHRIMQSQKGSGCFLAKQILRKFIEGILCGARILRGLGRGRVFFGFLAGWIVCIRGQIDTLPGRCGRRIRCLRGGAAACTSSDERQGQKQCRKKPQVYRFNRFHRGKSPFCKRRSPPRGTAIPTLYSICRENTT